ncbi:MAG: hypothetical protein WC657_01070 [Candidatus Paceibacterota bacterium]|jgi:hypothetical protein
MEYNLQIEFISRRGGVLGLFIKSDVIQTLPFEFGFRLKNIGNEPIKNINVSNIFWKSANGQDIVFNANKKYYFDIINPGEEIERWVEKVGTYAHGLCNFNLGVKSIDPKILVKTFQVDPFTKNSSFCADNNFVDFFFVRSKNEYEQNSANNYMLLFAVITTVLTVFTFYLNKQQVYYTEVQSRSERIIQARQELEAIERCKQSPELEDSGLYDTSSGKPASCKEVLSGR